MADDDDRLIQEVLAEFGRDADPKAIADRVKRLDLGLPIKDEFIAVCSWLGKTRLIHKLDQHQAPSQSRDEYQVPDLLAQLSLYPNKSDSADSEHFAAFLYP
ncbi:hypothetical protein U5922_000560 (plasmid) [Aquicoccus sp. G2-2]|uniref:hypothetical protein n=1 Tax=Aquicoccus sp. G2-2 TaxID=3092120 RepID=UPI002ADF074A|nr:hypothetical protein [Aquicoccus sp. G2-2]MEA1112025.1 hypothetical protein [Aquicoccus sp. G2-2]